MGGVPNYPYGYNPLLAPLFAKRKVFVSYHHDRDQNYYDAFVRTFSDVYEVVQDSSLDRLLDSDDPEYIMRRIREKHITGSSCTVVFCGAETPWRKYVDWEIKATLDKEHGLIGVNLPTNPLNASGRFTVADRLNDNFQSGYALWLQWKHLLAGPEFLKGQVEVANQKPKVLIVNNRPMRRRNGN